MNLQECVAVITGASSGIGEATARCLAQAGSQVILAARRIDRLNDLRDEIVSGGGSALALQTDVSERNSIDQLVDRVLRDYGQIDVLINNAGLAGLGWLEELDPESIRQQFAVNVLGTIEMTQAALPIMIKQRRGHIINVASIASKIATPTYSIYASTKFALDGFTQALRREVQPWGVKASILYLNSVDTEFAEVADIRRKIKVAMPRALILSSDAVARRILGLIKHPRSSTLMPWIMSGAVFFNHVTPWLVDWVTQCWVQIERSEQLRSKNKTRAS